MCNTLGNIFRLCIVGGCCLALAMQFVATFGCDFLTTPSTRGIGIWYVEEQGTGNCVEWSTTNLEMDDVVKGAQSALTLSTIAGFAAGVMVLFEWLLCEVCCAGCLEGLAFCSAWVLGCSTFMLYGIQQCGDIDGSVANGELQGDTGCEWGADASYMMVAVACYFICGFVLCCAPQPEPICKQ